MQYPYSTRESVEIVKHVDKFPEDGVVHAIENVLGFDAFDAVARRQLSDVFTRHGIPVPAEPLFDRRPQLEVDIAQEHDLGEMQRTGTWSTRPN